MAGSTDNLSEILILDPQSDQHVDRWKRVAPDASVIPLSGLPEGSGEMLSLSSNHAV